MSAPEPAVLVTLSTIYSELVELKGKVAQLATELPSHVSVTKNKQEEYRARLNAHADRIDTLETRVTRIEAGQRPPTPWYVVLSSVVTVLTGVATVVALVSVLSQLQG